MCALRTLTHGRTTDSGGGIWMNAGSQRVRELLAAPGIIVLPGSYDAVSARLMEHAGFEVVFTSGYSLAASTLGSAGHRSADRFGSAGPGTQHRYRRIHSGHCRHGYGLRQSPQRRADGAGMRRSRRCRHHLGRPGVAEEVRSHGRVNGSFPREEHVQKIRAGRSCAR